MDTLAFLQKILPADCVYFLDIPNPRGEGFKHFPFDDLPSMAAHALRLDEDKHAVYHACSGFRERSIEREVKLPDGGTKKRLVSRVQANVKLVRAFWLDLDVEPGNPQKYEDQQGAARGLAAFLRDSGLPPPNTVIRSGYGLHVYWALTETMLPGPWKESADRLKALTKVLSLRVDQTRTADEASVLRPVGTHNRKVKQGVQQAIPVDCVVDHPLLDTKQFTDALARAAKHHNAQVPTKRDDVTVNPTTLIVPDGWQESSAHLVASRCNQVKLMRDKGGNVSEPHWYRVIQVLDKTVEGETIIHEWSKPYPGYTYEETQKKVIQIKSMGPTTCTVLEEANPDGCKACPFKGRIASPIQLGVEIKEASAPVVTQLVEGNQVREVLLPNPPQPFKRGDAKNPGLYMEIEPGVPVRFYPYDLFPIELAYDELERYMTVKVRHHLPHEGWCDFPFRASLVSSVKEFSAAMIDRGVFPENAKVMAIYMDSYLKLLQSKTKSRQLHNSMGWKDNNTKFLLGKNMYMQGGQIEPGGLSKRVSKNAIEGVEKKGALEGWKQAVAYLGQEGLEGHLFGFLTGFGSPLLTFTGFRGCVMTLLGESNAGKSLTAMMAMSVYGNYEKLRLGKNDTLNARIERMNSLNNLPIYVDEFTNTKPEEASEFIYMASQGRGREKLYSDSTVRDAAEWSSITMVSSNKSVVGLLTLGKDNVEAEMLRLFEFWVPRLPWFEAQNTAMYDLIKLNHGHAGEVFVRHIVEHAEEMPALIRAVQTQITNAVGFEGRERFWISTAAVNIAGFIIATQLGLMPFADPREVLRRMFDWLKVTVHTMRAGLVEARVDYIDALGQFLNDHSPNTLIVEGQDTGGAKLTETVTRVPVRELVVREEKHTGLTYVDRKTLVHWLTRRQIDYHQMKKSLYSYKILRHHSQKKMLGAGFMASTQVPVWVIDTTAPIFKSLVMGEKEAA